MKNIRFPFARKRSSVFSGIILIWLPSLFVFAELSRIISEELTLEKIRPVSEKTTLIQSGRPVAKVIVPADRPLNTGEKEALDLLNNAYGAKFPLYKLKNGQLQLPDGDYILFDNSVKGLIVNRLLSRFSIDPEPGFYEVRNIRNAFQADCNILYFGGKPIEGLQRFIARQPKTDGDLRIGKYIDSEKHNRSEKTAASEKMIAAARQEIRDIYADESRSIKNMDAIRTISNLARTYNNTGDEKTAKACMELVQMMTENYESGKNWRKTPPSFRAQELAFAMDLLDESDALTNDDLVLCGNLLRRIAEDCMNYWEMREPMSLYNSGEIKYLTNHPLFASRTVSAIARFLQKRFDIPAADYWITVSANAFAGTAEADQGPEDSANYQWYCRKLYNAFALQSGDVPMITPNFRQYIEFAIAHYNQMGKVPSYGDAIPMKELSPVHMLKDGFKFYDDSLSAHILNSISTDDSFVSSLVRKLGVSGDIDYTPRMIGLTVFPLCDFLKNFYELENPGPRLNKAVFRSGYEPGDEYLMLNGINVPDHHGHLDGNSIVEYSRGNRYWLTDGDYLKKYTRDHNSITVSRNAAQADLRRSDIRTSDPVSKDDFAEISDAASAPDGSMGLTATTLHNYNGTDWTRNIFWSSLNGFWVIDRLNINEPGQYVVKCLWHTLGRVTQTNSTVQVRQKPAANIHNPDHLFIARGDDAVTAVSEQFDFGHSGPFGYYDAYPFAERTTKIISETRQQELATGDRIDYVNFFKTGYGNNIKQPKVRKAGDSAWIADCRQLAVLGSFQWFDKLTSGGLEIKLTAGRALVTQESILAIHATELQIGTQTVELPNEKTFSGKFGEGALAAIPTEKIGHILTGIYNTAKSVRQQPPKHIDVPQLAVTQHIKTPAPVSALATGNDQIVCGFENGDVAAYNAAGDLLWQSRVGEPVTALSSVKDGERTLWAVGTRYDNRESQTATVALLSGDGSLCWKKPIHHYHGRPGTVRNIVAAKLLPENRQQIVASSEAWKYLAFDLTGEKLWEFPVYHAATLCAAADMTGDGLDEIAAGSEYYYHWILNGQGKKLKSVLSPPADYSVLTADITGDGKNETVWGRGDGFIYVMRPGDQEKRYVWETNVGGLPTGIAETPTGELAVSTENNAIVFVNRSGEKTNVVYFPKHLYGIKNINGALYTACRDGFIYQIINGQITGKLAIPEFKAGVQPPLLNAVGTHPVIAAGNRILVLE